MRGFYRRARAVNRALARRAAIFAAARLALRKRPKKTGTAGSPLAGAAMAGRGYDPELLYVECGRCGAPVVWDDGRATKLLAHAGIDPIELDASCVLVTDACPACGVSEEYGVRIFRVTERSGFPLPPSHGHA